MADDLVAELTLRLRNEMTSGVDEVRAEFTGLQGTLEELRGTLMSVDRLMGEMPAPTGLQAALEGINAEADGTAAAMREMGATLDAEALKAREAFAETANLQAQLFPRPPQSEERSGGTDQSEASVLQQEFTAIGSEAEAAASAAGAIGAALQGASSDARALADETSRLQDAMSASSRQLQATLQSDGAEMQQLLAEMHKAQEELATPIKQPENSLTSTFESGAAAARGMHDAVADIGVAIDADAAKMQQLLTQMHAAQDEMRLTPPTDTFGGGGGGILPPVEPRPPEEPEPPGNPDRPQPGSSKSGGGFDLFGALLGAITGITGFDAWSDYDTAAKQVTVTEGLGPEAAQHEASRLKDMMNAIADRYYASSKDLMETYAFLITDSLSKPTVETMLPSLAEASTAYNVPTADIAQAAFTLTKNLGITPDKMGDALAVLHHATMQGHFTMEDFSQFLPELGGQESLIGMTGMSADVTTASALETIRKNTGTGGDAATELKEFLMYLHSMMALRMFDRTKRMEDMLGPSGKAIFDEYHIEPLDLPKYLDREQSEGVDPINAMTDYFSKLLAPVKSPIERADLVGAYFHNQAAQDAILALVQYQEDFQKYQANLSHVSDRTLSTDFDTATSGASADARAFHENLAQGMRMTGRLFDYPIEFGNWVWNPDMQHGPPPAGPGGSQSGITLSPHIPITVNVHVDKDGNATVTGGLAGAPNVTPGTNVRVDQGSVLTGLH